MLSHLKNDYFLRFAVAVLIAASGMAHAAPGDGFRDLLGNLGESLGRINGSYLEPTPGTASFEIGIEHQGLGRRVLYIRPDPVPPGRAPAVVFLSFTGATPETMANVVQAAQLAQKHGVWVILPSAVLRRWQESPNRSSSRDDLGYLSKVIRDATRRYPIDANRVYMAGLSNGGFMASRFACERPLLLAGLAVVGARLRKPVADNCRNARPLPLFMVNGEKDVLVPQGGRLGILSARQSLDFWEHRNRCRRYAERKTNLPDTTDDRKHTVQVDNTSCASGKDIRILTVINGGHGWPGADTLLSDTALSKASRDFDTTLKLWEFLRRFRRN